MSPVAPFLSRASRRRILLHAPAPGAVLAAMPPLPRSQRGWMVSLCDQISKAMGAVDDGKAKS